MTTEKKYYIFKNTPVYMSKVNDVWALCQGYELLQTYKTKEDLLISYQNILRKDKNETIKIKEKKPPKYYTRIGNFYFGKKLAYRLKCCNIRRINKNKNWILETFQGIEIAKFDSEEEMVEWEKKFQKWKLSYYIYNSRIKSNKNTKEKEKLIKQRERKKSIGLSNLLKHKKNQSISGSIKRSGYNSAEKNDFDWWREQT